MRPDTLLLPTCQGAFAFLDDVLLGLRVARCRCNAARICFSAGLITAFPTYFRSQEHRSDDAFNNIDLELPSI